jgi:circadian clock protein KaiB
MTLPQSAPADAGTGGEQTRYRLRLFVTGMTPRSTRAIEHVRGICERFLAGHYDLQVVDLYQQPDTARSEQLVAAPTLIKYAPPPQRRLIGDMSSELRVLAGLDIVIDAQV